MFLGRWGDLFVVMGVASPHRRSNRHSSDGPARATFRRLHSRVGAHHTFAPCDPSSGTGRSVKKKTAAIAANAAHACSAITCRVRPGTPAAAT